MRLSELERRQMAIIYILALLISVALFYQFVVSPETERYRTAVSQYNSQQQRDMRQVSRRDALVEQYLVLKEKADKTQKLLFTEREAEDFFLKKLPKLSSQTGNELKSMTPKDSQSLMPRRPRDPNQKDAPPDPATEVSQKPVPITLTGEYGDMIELFKALEENKKLMAISNVGVSAASADSREVSVRFSLGLIHARSDIVAPSEDILNDVLVRSQTPEAPQIAEDSTEQGTVAQETTVKSTDERAEPSWFSSILSRFRRKPDRPSAPPVELAETASAHRQDLTSAHTGSAREVTKRYSVQVGVFDIEDNVGELFSVLESEGYRPWVKPGLVTKTPPHYVFVGKFNTKTEADKFGETLLMKLSWISEYIVKEILLDYDTVLRSSQPTQG